MEQWLAPRTWSLLFDVLEVLLAVEVVFNFFLNDYLFGRLPLDQNNLLLLWGELFKPQWKLHTTKYEWTMAETCQEYKVCSLGNLALYRKSALCFCTSSHFSSNILLQVLMQSFYGVTALCTSKATVLSCGKLWKHKRLDSIGIETICCCKRFKTYCFRNTMCKSHQGCLDLQCSSAY